MISFKESNPGRRHAEANAMSTAALSAAARTRPDAIDPADPDGEGRAIRARVEEFWEALRPEDAFQGWLVERMAVDSLRVEQCATEEAAVRGLAARRAARCWDDDRRLDAEDLGRALPKKPRQTVLRLESTLHGVAWMLDRWRELLAAHDREGGWTRAQIDRALDLLGLPPEGRDPLPDLPAPPDVARSEIERLRRRQAMLGAPDAEDRALAEAGVGPHVEKAVRYVRRFERACFRRIEWAWSILKRRESGRPAPPPPPPVAEVVAPAPKAPAARTGPAPTDRPAGSWAHPASRPVDPAMPRGENARVAEIGRAGEGGACGPS